jgi:hypothetical protein
MQREWIFTDQYGVVTICLTADTQTDAVAISQTQNWHDHASLNEIISAITEAMGWLDDNREA